jgi:hypothetical protein
MMEDFDDSAFCVWSGWGSLAYDTCDVIAGAWLRFCFRCWRCWNMEYCMDCYDCENCFGCVGLRKKKYCILNGQYQEDEYWQKVDEIKCVMLERGEYGEFFPAQFSQNGLEYSMADVFLEFSEKELEIYHAPRFDPNRGGVVVIGNQKGQTDISIKSVPDCLSEVDLNTFVGKPLYDPQIKRNFSVTEREFAYYQKEGFAFPRQHFLTRLKNLIRQANTPISEETTCCGCLKNVYSFKNSIYQKRNIMCKQCYFKYLEQNG